MYLGESVSRFGTYAAVIFPAIGCAACVTPASDLMQIATVDLIVKQVKCEIAAGVNAPGLERSRPRVKGWLAKSVLQLKREESSSTKGGLGVSYISPSIGVNWGVASGQGQVQTKDLVFIDAFDTARRPQCATGGIEPEPYNNLGLRDWIAENLRAFDADNTSTLKQLGRTIVFTATGSTEVTVRFAVAPADANIGAESKRAGTNTLTIAMGRPDPETVYQVKLVGGSASILSKIPNSERIKSNGPSTQELDSLIQQKLNQLQ